jgi:hypothetical protein
MKHRILENRIRITLALLITATAKATCGRTLHPPCAQQQRGPPIGQLAGQRYGGQCLGPNRGTVRAQSVAEIAGAGKRCQGKKEARRGDPAGREFRRIASAPSSPGSPSGASAAPMGRRGASNARGGPTPDFPANRRRSETIRDTRAVARPAGWPARKITQNKVASGARVAERESALGDRIQYEVQHVRQNPMSSTHPYTYPGTPDGGEPRRTNMPGEQVRSPAPRRAS